MPWCQFCQTQIVSSGIVKTYFQTRGTSFGAREKKQTCDAHSPKSRPGPPEIAIATVRKRRIRGPRTSQVRPLPAHDADRAVWLVGTVNRRWGGRWGLNPERREELLQGMLRTDLFHHANTRPFGRGPFGPLFAAPHSPVRHLPAVLQVQMLPLRGGGRPRERRNPHEAEDSTPSGDTDETKRRAPPSAAEGARDAYDRDLPHVQGLWNPPPAVRDKLGVPGGEGVDTGSTLSPGLKSASGRTCDSADSAGRDGEDNEDCVRDTVGRASGSVQDTRTLRRIIIGMGCDNLTVCYLRMRW